jgi:hypothetical protein
MKKAQAAAQAKSDHYLALYKAAPEGKKKISYAKKEFAAAQKVADIDVEMKVIDNMDIQANKKLFHEYSTVESTAVGKAKITAAKESAEEKQQFTVERNDLAKEVRMLRGKFFLATHAYSAPCAGYRIRKEVS